MSSLDIGLMPRGPRNHLTGNMSTIVTTVAARTVTNLDCAAGGNVTLPIVLDVTTEPLQDGSLRSEEL
jgi:hypothetical protein